MLSLKISTGSSGITLTKEEMAQLGLRDGDILYLTEEADGSFRPGRRRSDHERQMTLAKRIMRDDREILRALAK